MEWLTNLAESGELLWGIVTFIGGSAVVNVITFFKVAASGKKITNVTDFTVIAKKTIDFAKDEFKTAKDQIVTEVKNKVVDPMVEQVNALTSDNAKLTEIAVYGLSLANIPLKVKKEIMEGIKTLGTISDSALKVFNASIESEEQQTNQNEEENQTLTDDINDI